MLSARRKIGQVARDSSSVASTVFAEAGKARIFSAPLAAASSATASAAVASVYTPQIVTSTLTASTMHHHFIHQSIANTAADDISTAWGPIYQQRRFKKKRGGGGHHHQHHHGGGQRDGDGDDHHRHNGDPHEQIKFLAKFRHVSGSDLGLVNLKKVESIFGTPDIRRHKFGFVGVCKIRTPTGSIISCAGFHQKRRIAGKLALYHAHLTIQANKNNGKHENLREIPPITLEDSADTVDNLIPTLPPDANELERNLHLEIYRQQMLPETGDDVFDRAAELVDQYAHDERKSIRALFKQSCRRKPNHSKHIHGSDTFWIAHIKVPGYKKGQPAVGVALQKDRATHLCYVHALLMMRILKEGGLDLTLVEPQVAGLVQFYMKARKIKPVVEVLTQEGNHTVVKVTIGEISATAKGINELEAQKLAAVQIVRQLPQVDRLFAELLQVRKSTSAEINSSIPTVVIPPEIRERILSEYNSLPVTEVQQLLAPVHSIEHQKPDEELLERESEKMLQLRNRMRESDGYKRAFEPKRKGLSIAKFEQEIVDTVRNNQVTIICGTTGCGKTTQVPQYLLDDAIDRMEGARCKMFVTQPRRINAVSISERIACERLQKVRQDAGYWVRLDRSSGRHITLMTTGILMSLLVSDPTLSGITHLVIDEIHERDVNCDVVLRLVKMLCERRKELRVVLMSATMQSKLFAAYFKDAPIMNVEGRMFPVTKHYLEDVHLASMQRGHHQASNIITQYHNMVENSRGVPPKINPLVIAYTVRHALDTEPVGRENAILIFVPGWADIVETERTLQQDNPTAYHFIRLHSSISIEGQRATFRPAPEGKVKIIIATNIAESGVTIDGVTVVIDTCISFLTYYTRRHSERSFVTEMKKQLISKANMTQRMGRAGRTRNGRYFSLVPRPVAEDAKDFIVPEIMRVSLENVILRLLGMGFSNAPQLLQEFIEPPPDSHVEAAMADLIDLGAVDREGKLTLLGYHLAKIPTDPRQSRIMLASFMLDCLEGGMSVVAATEQDPFTTNKELRKDVRNAKRLFALGTNSDHLAKVNALHSWIVDPTVANDYNLDVGSCKKLMSYREQYRKVLSSSLRIDEDSWSSTSVSNTNEPAAASLSEDAGEDADDSANVMKREYDKLWGEKPVVVESPVQEEEESTDDFNVTFLRAAVAGGYFPKVALCYRDTANRTDGKRYEGTFRTKKDSLISLNSGCAIDPKNDNLPSPFYVVYDSIFVPPHGGPKATNASYITMMDLILIGAPTSKITFLSGLDLAIIDDWIPFHVSQEDCEAIFKLKTLMDIRMWSKLDKPRDKNISSDFSRAMSIVKHLLKNYKSFDPEEDDEDELDGGDDDDDDEEDTAKPVAKSRAELDERSTNHTGVSETVINFHEDTPKTIAAKLQASMAYVNGKD